MTDTPEMVERVKAAIRGAEILHADLESWDVVLRHAARAAIEAMREPTEAMLTAPLGDTDCSDYLDDYSAKQVWQTMIDAALGKDAAG